MLILIPEYPFLDKSGVSITRDETVKKFKEWRIKISECSDLTQISDILNGSDIKKFLNSGIHKDRFAFTLLKKVVENFNAPKIQKLSQAVTITKTPGSG